MTQEEAIEKLRRLLEGVTSRRIGAGMAQPGEPDTLVGIVVPIEIVRAIVSPDEEGLPL